MASTSPPPPIAPRTFSVHRRWSSESESVEHKEIQATAMGLSVNDNGQFALLGGRKSLGLINLSDPKTVAFRSMRNVGKWEVTIKCGLTKKIRFTTEVF